MIEYRIRGLLVPLLAVLMSAASLGTSRADDSATAEVASHEELAETQSSSHEESADDDHHPQDKHGSDDHGSSSFLLTVDPGAAFWNLAIFLIVFLVLAKFVWPPILSGIQARESKIHDDLLSAQNAKLEAESMLSEYQAKLDQAQVRVHEMVADARHEAEKTKQDILEAAQAEADRQRDRAVAEIQSAKNAALGEVAQHSTALALQMARQVVGRELKESDHADLIRQSLDNLPSNN